MKINQYIFNGCDEEKNQIYYYKMLYYDDDKLYSLLLLALFHHHHHYNYQQEQQIQKQSKQQLEQIKITISFILSLLPIINSLTLHHIIIIEKLLMNKTFITTKLTLFLKQKLIINCNNNIQSYSDNVNDNIY